MLRNIEMFKNASDEGFFWVQNSANLWEGGIDQWECVDFKRILLLGTQSNILGKQGCEEGLDLRGLLFLGEFWFSELCQIFGVQMSVNLWGCELWRGAWVRSVVLRWILILGTRSNILGLASEPASTTTKYGLNSDIIAVSKGSSYSSSISEV